MRIWQAVAGVVILAGSSLAGAAAYEWEGAGFFYSPVPRWAYDPKQDLDFGEKVCPEIRRECPGLDASDINVEVAYDELYYANGRLAGVRMTKGSGCRPLDEAIVLGNREFRGKFERDGMVTDDVKLELGDGVDKAKVRIVKEVASSTFAAGCLPD